MHELGYISDKQYETAKAEELKVKTDSSEFGVHAEYVAELARQLVYEQFKEDTYTRGLNVFTTITKADQDAAYLALRKGVMDYERRHAYRGPEAYIDIPAKKEEADDAIETVLAEHPDNDDLIAAVVLSATPQLITAVTASGDEIKISGAGLEQGRSWLSDKNPPNKRIRRGAVIRVLQEGKDWLVAQMPEIESAIVAAT
jgi:penicillin-binding protein 1A